MSPGLESCFLVESSKPFVSGKPRDELSRTPCHVQHIVGALGVLRRPMKAVDVADNILGRF